MKSKEGTWCRPALNQYYCLKKENTTLALAVSRETTAAGSRGLITRRCNKISFPELKEKVSFTLT